MEGVPHEKKVHERTRFTQSHTNSVIPFFPSIGKRAKWKWKTEEFVQIEKKKRFLFTVWVTQRVHIQGRVTEFAVFNGKERFYRFHDELYRKAEKGHIFIGALVHSCVENVTGRTDAPHCVREKKKVARQRQREARKGDIRRSDNRQQHRQSGPEGKSGLRISLFCLLLPFWTLLSQLKDTHRNRKRRRDFLPVFVWLNLILQKEICLPPFSTSPSPRGIQGIVSFWWQSVVRCHLFVL